MYLHDDDGVGTPHFVANVLCSRRFNNRLYDANIMIWPLDLTGVMRPQRVSRSAKPAPKNMPPAPVPTTRSARQRRQLLPQPRARQTPPTTVAPASSASPSQTRQSCRSRSSCVTPRARVREQHSVPPPPSAEADRSKRPKAVRRYFWQPPLPRMAENLLMMFAQHPAGATFDAIVSVSPCS
ncbi:hypothetical protein SprV_0602148600 [Sparganum proliferum]